MAGKAADMEKKVDGKVVLIERRLFDLRGMDAAAVDPTLEFSGGKVELRLVSATVGDPKNANRGLVGPPAYLEKVSVPAADSGESTYEVTFTVIDSHGIPGAVIVKNHHPAEFFLKRITIENFPGKGRIQFDCNSWVYSSERYAYDCIFFANEYCLPKNTPDLLQVYIQDDLKILREDDVNRKLEEWDRAYNDAFSKTGRLPTKSDPTAENPPSNLEFYVPHDERFIYKESLASLGRTLKSVANDFLPMLHEALNMTATEFVSLREVLDLYGRGLSLPNIPVVRKFLETAPTDKFISIVMSATSPFSPNQAESTFFGRFKDMLPMLKVILNFNPSEYDSFKQVLNLYGAGLPLPDIFLVRKFLEHAPGEKFKPILAHNIGGEARVSVPEEPFKKLKDVVHMLQVFVSFTADEIQAFKKVLEEYEKGLPLANIPLIRKFFEVAPFEMFKGVITNSINQESFFKSLDDAPLEKHFKVLVPMLKAIIDFTPDELHLFRNVLDHYEGGFTLPDIPLVKKFLDIAPCEKFKRVYIPNMDQGKLFKFPEALSLEKFKELVPLFRVILRFMPNELDSFKEVLGHLKDGSLSPNHPLLQKLFEVPPLEKFKDILKSSVNQETLFALPKAEPLKEIFRELLPILQTVMNFTQADFGSFKDVLGQFDGDSPSQESSLQKFLKFAPCEKLKVVFVPTEFHQSLFRLPEVSHLERHFNDLLPMLHAILHLSHIELSPFKKVVHQHECGFPLPDIPLVQKFINNVPCEKFKSVLVPHISHESSFNIPEVPPIEKLKDIIPMLHVIINFTPLEIDSFKKVIELYKSKSLLADNPLVRKLLEVAPNKMFRDILTHSVDHGNLFSLPKSAPLERYFNDMLPVLQFILNMDLNELQSFKQVLDHHKDGHPLPDIPLVHKFLEVAPCEKFKSTLMPTINQHDLVKSPEGAPLAKHFKDHLPMLHFIMNMAPNEFDSFKKLLINYEAQLPLPNIPKVRKFLELVPIAEFKQVTAQNLNKQGNLSRLPEANPVETFKDLLPMLQVIMNFRTHELDSFKQALGQCKSGLPLPDIPQVRSFLEAAPYAKFKSIISTMDPGCLFKSSVGLPLEKYLKNLLSMLHVITNLAPNELDTFKEVLENYEDGLPLPSIPLVQKFLELAPCEKFKSVLIPNVDRFLKNSILEKFNDLMPILQILVNFKPNEFDTFKDVLKLYEAGSPLPDIPLARKLLKVKFQPKFVDSIEEGSLFSFPEAKQMEMYFKDLLPMIKMLTNLKSQDVDLIKEVLRNYEAGSPLQDNPVIRNFLKVAPCERFKCVLIPVTDQSSLFKLPQIAPLEKFFKGLLPMLQSIINFTPKEFGTFKEVVHQHEYGLPLPDIVPVRKFLAVEKEVKLKVSIKHDDDQDSSPNLAEGAPIEKLKDILPMLHVIFNFEPKEFDSFKILIHQYETGSPLQDNPLVRKVLEVAPYANIKGILKRNIEHGTLFKLPEAAPLEKFLKELMPMLLVILNMIPSELDSFKRVLDHYEHGLSLPNIPAVQKFIKVAPCEEFKPVLMPKLEQKILEGTPMKTFKDIVPMLQVIMDFNLNEISSLKEILSRWEHGSSSTDVPVVQMLLKHSPFERDNAMDEKHFRQLLPMLQTIINFPSNEFETFKKVLQQYKDGFPLPNIPLVLKLLEVAPCEKFKPILMPHVTEDKNDKFPETTPVEKTITDKLPQLKIVMNLKVAELYSFKKVLKNYEAGLLLPNIPLFQQLLSITPLEKKLLIPLEDSSNEKFHHLIPMLQAIIDFTHDEAKSFADALEPLMDIPLVRKFLNATPYENFKTFLNSNANKANLFELPEAAPLVKYLKSLRPMLQVVINLTSKEINTVKKALEKYINGLPLPHNPFILKLLQVAPCEKFKPILKPIMKFGSPLVNFQDLLPILLVIIKLTPDEFKSFKESLDLCKDGSPLPKNPLIQKFLKFAPFEKYFKDILPMLQVTMKLPPSEFDSIKKALKHREDGLPLPDLPPVRKILEAAPCEKFKSVLTPSSDQDRFLFLSPETTQLEKHFKAALPMFQMIVNFKPKEFISFKEAVHHCECGLPLTDVPLVRNFVKVAAGVRLTGEVIDVPAEKLVGITRDRQKSDSIKEASTPMPKSPIPKVSQDPHGKSPSSNLEKYVPHDECVKNKEPLDFLVHALKTGSNDLLPKLQDSLNMTPTEFSSFKEVLDHYEHGLPLPDIAVVRKFLEAAPTEKFKSVVMFVTDQFLTHQTGDVYSEMFRDMLPMLKIILNFKPIEFDSFKEVLNLYGAGLPLPDIFLVRKLLEHAPGEKFKPIFAQNVDSDDRLNLPEEPFKKLKNLVHMLQVFVNFTTDEIQSFKKALDSYEKGLSLPNIPLVRKFLEVAPFEIFKSVLTGSINQDSLFKSPDDAPLEKHFKCLLRMLKTLIDFTPNELQLFKKVLDHYEGGITLPDIPLVKKFLEVIPCEKFKGIYIPNMDQGKLFIFPVALSLEKFKDLLLMFQVILKFKPNELDSLKEVLDHIKDGSLSPKHPLIPKLFEVPPLGKFKDILKSSLNHDTLFALPEAEPLKNTLRDLLPILQTIMNFTPADFGSFKDVVNHFDGASSLQGSPLLQKFLQIAPCEKTKLVFVPIEYYQNLFRLPEVSPLEKHFNDLLSMLYAIMKLNPIELDPFKKVVHQYECGLQLPDIPLVQNFIRNVRCEKFKSVLVPHISKESSFNIPKVPPLEKLKDIIPMLHVVINFTPVEFDSFKKVLELYKSKSSLTNSPSVRKLLEVAPNKMFIDILKHSVDKENLFSLPKSAPLEKYFNSMLPMLQFVVNMDLNELQAFKQVLDHHKDGHPLPDIPLVHKFLEVAPCEKFKSALMPTINRHNLLKSPEAEPLEKHFKDHLPMLHFIMNMAPNDFDSFKKLLIYYEARLPLPDIPQVRKLLEFVPNKELKKIFASSLNKHEDLFKLPEAKPVETFKDLLPMLQVIVNFRTHELDSFKKALEQCKNGLPLPDIPQVRSFLQAAPYAKFKSIISSIDPGCLFKSSVGLPLEKYLKNLLSMLHVIINLSPNELHTFKDVLDNYEDGLPLPDIALVQKFLEVAPCEKFKSVLIPDVDRFLTNLEKFKDLMPILQILMNFKPDEFDKFKDVLKLYEAGSPLPDIPLARKVLKAKFQPTLVDGIEVGSLFSLPEAKQMEKYFKDLLPMIKMLMNLKPTDFELFKKVLSNYEAGFPLQDNLVIRNFLKVAPCEKFKCVLIPITDQNSLFKLPQGAHLEKCFKDLLPMLQSITSFTPKEFGTFKEVVHQHEYGLPLPDIVPVRKFLVIEKEVKFKASIKYDDQRSSPNLAEGAPIEKLKDILPMLHIILKFEPKEFDSFKIMIHQYETGSPLQDNPLVRKVLEVAPYENIKGILKRNIELGTLFKLPEAAPMEKLMKYLVPMFRVILNMIPSELESFKEVLDHYDQGLSLPNIPPVQKFLKVAPCEEFKPVVMPKVDQNIPKGTTTEKFKDIVPMLRVIMDFNPSEINSLKEVLNRSEHGPLSTDVPIVQKIVEASPFQRVNIMDNKFFKELLPMLQVIINFSSYQFDTFKKVLQQYKDGFPLPNIPLVQKLLRVAPCEKFKPILMPHLKQSIKDKSHKIKPTENFKKHLPRFKIITNLKSGELHSFKKVLKNYEAGLPLPNIPMFQMLLGVAPIEKKLITPFEDSSKEKFHHLLPMLQVIINFTHDEAKKFADALNPLKDIPLVRKFLKAAPYETFKEILNRNANKANLFDLSEAAPLEKYMKSLCPMLQVVINLTFRELNTFKKALDKYANGLPLPHYPFILKLLQVAPCEKFKPILKPVMNTGCPLVNFQDLQPILLVLITLTVNEFKSFKELLELCKDGSPLPDNPLVQKFRKFVAFEKYFKDILPMLQAIVKLPPNELDLLKEALKHRENGLPLPDLPLVRKILEAAPCEKFKTVLTPSSDQDRFLFLSPETVHLKKQFKATLPMFQMVINFKPSEFSSFKEAVHHYEYGLPLPDLPLVQKIVRVAAGEKLTMVIDGNIEVSSP